MKKNKTTIIILLCIILFLMMVGFAAFSQRLEISEKAEVTTNWNIYISKAEVKESTGTGTGTANINDRASVTLSPIFKNRGDSVTYNVTVTNGGDVDAILETLTLGEYDTSTITVTIDGIAEGDTLTQSESKTFTVEIKYNENTGTLTQATGEITLDLKFVQSSGPSGGSGSGTNAATMLASNVVTSGDGLYTDPVETGRYVYRGADPNNYIWLDLNGDSTKTDNETYRIVAVESDNTIKVVADTSMGNKVFDPGYSTAIDGVTSASSMTGTRWSSTSTDYCYYSTSTTSYNGCKVWGSKTTMLDASGNNITVMPREAGSTTTYTLPTNEAYLNTYLNTTFLNSIDTDLQSKIATHTYNVGLLAYNNSSLETDITQEQAYKWKGKIGLINPTDYVRASTNTSCTNVYAYYNTSACYNNSASHNYLFNSTNEWTMNPYSSSSSRDVWYVFYNGFAYYSLGVAPVLYLTSDISLSGKGTSGEPYEIG